MESWAQPSRMREQWSSGKGLSLRFKLAGEPKMRGPIKSKELLDSAWWDKITLRRFCLTLIGAFLFWLKGWGENPALHFRAVQQCRNLPAYRVSLNLKLLFPDLSCPSPCPRIPEQLMFAAVRGYVNLSLLTLLGWQQWRTETKSLHNQRPQQFTPAVSPDVWNSFSVQDCLYSTWAKYSQLRHLWFWSGKRKATPPDQRGVILLLFILCPACSASPLLTDGSVSHRCSCPSASSTLTSWSVSLVQSLRMYARKIVEQASAFRSTDVKQAYVRETQTCLKEPRSLYDIEG